MAETRTTSTKAVEKRTTPNESEDLPRGVVEELAALRAIVEGTAHSTGEEFIQTLVRHLARTVDAHYAFVAEFWRSSRHCRQFDGQSFLWPPQNTCPSNTSGRMI